MKWKFKKLQFFKVHNFCGGRSLWTLSPLFKILATPLNVVVNSVWQGCGAEASYTACVLEDSC